MERFEPGMLAWSRAGHDLGTLYVILSVSEDSVMLVDGRLRTLARPKKKKKKHIQVIRRIPEELAGMPEANLRDEDIRRVIRRFSNV
ncbi:MAG: KOW domain-containing RNA-binding protein [Eubacteriales bacterium]|nr:KOW domain-containing RNA-binding protein [Eubacteriales bacterium]